MWQIIKKNKLLIMFLVFIATLFSFYLIRLIISQRVYVSIDDIKEYNFRISEEEIYIAELKNKRKELLNNISDYYSHMKSGKKTILSLKSEVKKYKILSGFSDMHGEGVILIIDDGLRDTLEGEDPSSIVVHDLDVRKLINQLRNSGAEVISVNGNRIVAGLSEVVCNGPTIKINGEQQARPYVIKAIGDRYKLASALLDPEGYGVGLMKYGIYYEVLTKTDLNIDSYQGLKLFQHAKKAED